MNIKYKTLRCKIYFAIAIVLFAFDLNAQEIVPFTQRTSLHTPDKKIYSIKGDFQMIGNSNLALSTYSDGGSNQGQMKYVDIDDDPSTINSSSATLGFSTENGANPQCSNIIYAGLYWTGRAHNGTASPESFIATTQTLYNNYTVTGTNYKMTLSWNYNTNSLRYTYQPISGTGDIHHLDFNTDIGTITATVNGIITDIDYYSEVSGSNTLATFNKPYIIGDFAVSGLYRRSTNAWLMSTFERYSYSIVGKKVLNKRQVKLKYSTGNYIKITASQDNIYYPSQTEGLMYSAYAEITDYVRQYGLGEYFVADMAIKEGIGGAIGFYGGWGMIVIYENSKMKYRDITIFDGHAYVAGASNSFFVLPVSGFNTIKSGNVNMKLGLIAGEGDRGIFGDYFKIRDHADTSWVTLKHGGNTSNNFFNSSVYTGGNARNPDRLNNLGLDIAMFNIPNANNSVITNNQTSTTFQYGTSQDTYIINCIAMSVDAYKPEPECYSSVLTVNGAPYNSSQELLPGDVIEFSLDVKNKGSEQIDNLTINLPLPPTVEYVSSSDQYFDITTGSVVYNVGAGAGSITWNVGNIPAPDATHNSDFVYAKLKYKVKVTKDCNILRNTACGKFIISTGSASGSGHISGSTFDVPIISGYQQSSGCQGEPITSPLQIPVNATAYVNANCTGTSTQNLYFCNIATPNIPFNTVSPNFPAGSRFYSAIVENPQTQEMEPATTATEYTSATGFPKTVGVSTYYALPPGLNHGCFFKFQIDVTQINSTPTVPNGGIVYYCQGETAAPLTATPSNTEYKAYYYTSQTGGVPQLSITPSTANVGSTDYWVAEGSSSQCISQNRVKITVVVKANPTATISGGKVVCQNTVPYPDITFSNPQGEAIIVTYSINGGSDLAIEVPASGNAKVGCFTNTPGRFIYVLKSAQYVSSPSCVNTITGSAEITVPPLPDVTVSSNATGNTICKGGSATLTATGASTYTWSPTGSLSSSTGSSVTATPNGNITYTVTGVSEEGCVNQSSIDIKVNNVSSGTLSGDQTICNDGDPAVITSSAPGTGDGTITYRWESSTTAGCSTGFTTISGATGASYAPPAGLTTTTYYRRVTISTLNGVSCEATTPCVAVYVNNATGGEIGSNQVLCSNTPSSLTNTTVGTGTGSLTYRWEQSTTDCNSGFTTISGATGVNYQPSAISQTTYYRRITISNYNGVECEAASNCITVKLNTVNPGSISSDQTICEGGDPVAFSSVSASSSSGTIISYQWQSSTNSTTGFTDIDGATQATYDAPSGITQTTYYRRIASSVLDGTTCSAISNTIQVTVNKLTKGSIGGTQTICSGGNPSPLINEASAVGSGTLTYYWEESTTGCEGTWTTITGATEETYDPGVLTQSTSYRRTTVSTLNGVSCSATSNCVTITVSPDVSITTQPEDKTVCKGNTAQLRVIASGGISSLVYQWQSSADGSTNWTDVGTNSNTYNAPTTVQGTTYYRVVISTEGLGCDPLTSNVATVVVNESPQITSQSNITENVDNGYCYAQVNYTITSTGSPAPDYSFHIISGPGVTTGVTTGGGTGSSLEYKVGTTRVEVTATNSCGSHTIGFNVTVTDNIKPTITNCPTSDITADTDADATTCSKNITIPDITYSDNCAVTALTWKITRPDATIETSPSSGINQIGTKAFKVGTSVVKIVAKDASGNTSDTCIFNVVVTDKTPPALICPIPAEVYYTDEGKCTYRGDFTVAPVDYCGNPVTVTYIINENNGLPAFETTMPYDFNLLPPNVSNVPHWITTVTIKATDGVNETECSFDVKVKDKQVPVIGDCPNKPSLLYGCSTDVLVSGGYPAYSETVASATSAQFNAAGGTYTNNCPGGVNITYTDTKRTLPDCSIEVTRVWVVKDLGGNAAAKTCTQIIKIKNNTVPVVPANDTITISCFGLIPADNPPAEVFPTVKDACSGDIIQPTKKEVVLNPSPITCEGTQTFVYEYKDCAGNISTWKYTYNVDMEDFTYTKANTERTVSCVSEVTEPSPDGPGAEQVHGVCGKQLFAKFIKVEPANYKTLTCYQGDVVFTYEYDDCTGEHAKTYTHTVHVNSTATPTASFPTPQTANYYCKTQIEPENINKVTVNTTECGGPPTVTVEVTNDGGTGCNGNPYREYHKYTVTDTCSGQTTEYTQTFIVEDKVGPTFENFPADQTVQLPASGGVDVNIVGPTATDGCTPVANIVIINDANASNSFTQTYPTAGTYEITFTATDACGNANSRKLKIYVVNNNAPTINCPNSITVNCWSNVPAAFAAGATGYTAFTAAGGSANGNGGASIVPADFKLVSADTTNNCPTTTIARTYEVKDNAVPPNSAQCTQYLYLTSLPPQITGSPETQKVGCSPTDAPAPVTNFKDLIGLGFTIPDTVDCISKLPYMLTSSQTVSKKDTTGTTCSYTITRTYTIKNLCEQTASATHTIKIENTGITVTNDYPGGNIPDIEEIGCSMSDIALPATTVQQFLTRFNQITITGCNLHIRHDESVDPTVCPIKVVRTYTISDDCGHSKDFVVTHYLKDETPPTFNLTTLADKTVEGCKTSDMPAKPTTLAELSDAIGLVPHDNCMPDNEIEIVSITDAVDNAASTACDTVVVRTYKFKDKCNNEASISQNFHIKDTKAPEVALKNPDYPYPLSYTFEYIYVDKCVFNENEMDQVDILAPPVASIENLLNINNNLSITDCQSTNSLTLTHRNTISFISPGYSRVTRDYIVTDQCGNSVNFGDIDLIVPDEDDPTIIYTINGAYLQNIIFWDGTPPVVKKDGDTVTQVTSQIYGCSLKDVPPVAKTGTDFQNQTGTTIFDNCVTDPNEFVIELIADEEVSGTCPYTVIRKYSIADDVGNSTYNEYLHPDDYFTHTIIINDTDPPLVTGTIAEREIYGCSTEALPSEIATIETLIDLGLTISDCTPNNELKVVHTEDEVVQAKCPIIVDRKGYIEDKCGNKTYILSKFKIIDNTPPQLTSIGVIPSGRTNIDSCVALIPSAKSESEIASQFEDNCKGTVTVTLSEDRPTTNSDCGWEVTYTYEIKDECGKVVTPSPTIRYSGKVQSPPKLIGAAPVGETGIEACYIDANTKPEGVPDFDATTIASKYTSACGTTVTVTLNSTTISGNNCAWSVNYDYNVEDECGNKLEHESISHTGKAKGTITGTAPVGVTGIDACYVDGATVPQGVPAFNPSVAAAGYSNACGGLHADLTSTTISGDNCAWTVVYTFEVHDECDNELTGQTITHTGSDQTPPVITSAPIDTIVGCKEDIPPTDFDRVIATDNCTSEEDLVKTLINFPIASCLNRIIYKREYTVKDACGNETTHTQTIIVRDTIAPEFTGIPDDITVSCTNDIPVAPEIGVEITATDNCASGEISYSPLVETSTQNPDPSTCEHYNYTLTRTWKATDVCGNEVIGEQVITVHHEDPVSIPEESLAELIVEGCSVNDAPNVISTVGDLRTAGAALTSIPCNIGDAYLTVVNSEESISASCPIKFKRIHTIKDPCGDIIANVTRIVTIKDETAPVITNIPSDITLVCNTDIPESNTSAVVATDNCGGTVTVTVSPDVISDSTASHKYTISRTYKAQDVCGNESIRTQTITVNDNIPPSITCPSDVTVEVDAGKCSASNATLGVATTSDNCAGDVTITNDAPTEFPVGTTAVTWTATDASGNTSTCTQHVTVNTITAIATHPLATHTICLGSTPATISVVATGTEPFTYQWYVNSSNNNTDGDLIDGATNSSYTPPLATTVHTKYYYVIVTDYCGGTAVSNTSEVLINFVNAGIISADQTICNGTTPDIISLIYEESGSGLLSYQWQQSTDGSTWTDIAEANQSQYDPGVITINTWYRLQVTSTYNEVVCVAHSNVSKITVNENPECTITGNDALVCPGSTISYTAPDGMSEYEWTITGNATISGDNTSSTVNVVAGSNFNQDYTISLKIVKVDGCQSTCERTATVKQSTTISTHPVSASYCKDEVATTLSVTASGQGALRYQWYSNTTNSNTGGTPISGATSRVYAPSTSEAGTKYYYVVVSSDCGDATSNPAEIIVHPEVTYTVSSKSISCAGAQDGEVTVTVTSGTANYTIELYKDGELYKTATDVGSPHKFDNLPDGNYYVTVTDSKNCSKDN